MAVGRRNASAFETQLGRLQLGRGRKIDVLVLGGRHRWGDCRTGREVGLDRLLPVAAPRCCTLTWTPSGIGQVRMSRQVRSSPKRAFSSSALAWAFSIRAPWSATISSVVVVCRPDFGVGRIAAQRGHEPSLQESGRSVKANGGNAEVYSVAANWTRADGADPASAFCRRDQRQNTRTRSDGNGRKARRFRRLRCPAVYWRLRLLPPESRSIKPMAIRGAALEVSPA